MTVKRRGRLFQGDRVEVDLTAGETPDDRAALAEILQAATPRARIERIASVLPEQAATLAARLTDGGTADGATLDAIEQAEHEAHHRRIMQAAVREHNRLAKLPKADAKHQRWREIADDIRTDKPHLRRKTDIARAVLARLKANPDDSEFVASVETIRRKI